MPSRRATERLVVLGAGIQGVSVALALRDRYRVTIIDQADGCLQRASLRNEGKIHLGLLFANDASLRTAALMQRGAFAFAPRLERWLGEPVPWERFTTPNFAYCLGVTSMLTRESILDYYGRVEALFLEALADPEVSYLGRRPDYLVKELDAGAIPELSRSYASPLALTAEVALDRTGFSAWLGTRFERFEDVRRIYDRRVTEVRRSGSGFEVELMDADGTAATIGADVVVNCLWSGRLAIDQTMGLAPRRPWVHRLKYRVFVRLPETLRAMPPMTFTFGPYGDIVTFPDGLTYLSFYPLAIQGWSTEIAPPGHWEAAAAGRADPSSARELGRRIIHRLDEAIPGLAATVPEVVDAGMIFTWGTTDIDRIDSELHERSDVGVEDHDGYFSIDTGKYTTAPLFAGELAAMLE